MNQMNLKNNRLRSMTSENQETQMSVKKIMEDEWKFCLGLHLHPGRRPRFILGCRSTNAGLARNCITSRISVSRFIALLDFGTSACVEFRDFLPLKYHLKKPERVL